MSTPCCTSRIACSHPADQRRDLHALLVGLVDGRLRRRPERGGEQRDVVGRARSRSAARPVASVHPSTPAPMPAPDSSSASSAADVDAVVGEDLVDVVPVLLADVLAQLGADVAGVGEAGVAVDGLHRHHHVDAVRACRRRARRSTSARARAARARTPARRARPCRRRWSPPRPRRGSGVKAKIGYSMPNISVRRFFMLGPPRPRPAGARGSQACRSGAAASRSTRWSCARHLVAGDLGAAVLDELLEGRGLARARLHDGGHPLAPPLVGDADHEGVEHLRVAPSARPPPPRGRSSRRRS